MSSQTVVDVVVSGTTATVVDARVDGVTTVAGAAPVTTVSGQVPDIGVITDFRTENITLTSDGFNILSGNLVSTGEFLTDEIAIVSGIAGGQDLTSLSGTVDTLSGNVIATGQYLTSEIAIVSGLAGGQDIDTLSGNLIETGQYLTDEIAIVSGLTTGSSSDPALSGKVDTLSGNLIATGAIVDDISGNLIITGQTLEDKKFDKAGGIISGNILPSATETLDLGSAAAKWDNLYVKDAHIDSSTLFLGTGGANIKVVSKRVQVQGEDSADGAQFIGDTHIDAGTLFAQKATGPQFKILNTNATNLYEFELDDDGHLNISGNLTGAVKFADPVTVEGSSVVTANQTGAFAESANLVVTGQTLTSNLISTGNFLDAEIAIVSGIATGGSEQDFRELSGNLITTGQTLQTQITSNDSDISTLTTNLIATGSVVDGVSGNLITTGQTLQTQITSNDSDISTITNNLVTTGQTLQTQITSNDSDISTLTSNLITTGQTLTDEIAIVSGIATGGSEQDFRDLSGNLITTGQTLTSEIGIVSGLTVANLNNLVSTGSVVDDVSGNLITTGQTLTTNVNTISTNLIATGKTLTDNINTVSSNLVSTGSVIDDVSGNLATTGQTLQTQITSNDGDITTLTSNLITTGQTLTTNINAVSSNLVSTGAVVDDISGNLGTTGQTLQTQITANDGDITTLTSNLVTTGQTLTTNINTVATNLGTSGQTLQTQITSNDSDISTLTSNLGTTGQTLQTQITSNDSDIASLTTNLGTTGQTLQTQITSNDSDISTLDSTTVKLTTNQSIAGNKIFTNDVTINNLTVTGTEVVVDVENLAVKDNIIEINSGESGAGISRISGGIVIDRGTATNANILYNDANDRFELNFPLAVEGEVVASASNLITTGQTLTTNINTVSTNLGTSGQTLQTQITSNDSDISTLTTNLGTTGQTLQTQITSNDSDISTLTTNLGTTGQTLQTQITSNDSDISTLTSNLVTTGQTLTTNINTVSTNLISTGKVVDDISGNLITTGQTLQTQITSNDTDITNLSSNLVTTGQTLTTNINTVATNLVTTGQTLTSEIATVSGLIPATVIDGGGTANKVPLWSDANTIGDSVISQSNGKIGIGDATPDFKLDVAGAGRFAGDNSATPLTVNGGTATLASIQLNGGTNAVDNSSIQAKYSLVLASNSTNGISNRSILFKNGTTEQMRISSDGSVGIGTNAPTEPLHVESTAADILINSTTANQATRIRLKTTSHEYRIGTQGTADNFWIYDVDNAAYRMVISPAGAVGINTTSPNASSKLHVYGWTIIQSATNFASLRLQSTTGSWDIDNNDGTFGLQWAGGDKFNITSAGSVGIGTNAPTEMLHINKSSGTGSFIRFEDTGGGGVYIGARSNVMELYAGGAERMRIASDGKVGIGTNAPAYAVDVRMAAADLYIKSTTGTNRTGFQAGNNGGSSYFYRESSSGGGAFSGTAAYATVVGASAGAYPLQLGTNNAVRMTIDSDGNVGIGTNNPGSMLQVDHSGGADVDILTLDNNRNTASDQWGIKFQDSFRTRARIQAINLNTGNARAGLAFEVGFSTDTVERMRINDNGNVGIGTDNPTLPLHIYRASGNVYAKVQNASTSQAALQLQTATTDGNWVMYIPSNSSNLRFYRGADKVTLTADGSVGIGTNNPSVKLHVVTSSVGTTPSTSLDDLVVENNGAGGITLINKNDSAAGIAFADDDQAIAGLISYNHNGNNLRFTTNGNTEAMRIDSSQQVGIGTNAPDTKLHIEGTTKTSATIESTGNHAELIIKSENNTYSPYVVFKDAGADRYFIQANPSDSLLFRPQGTGTTSNWIVFSSSGSLGIGTQTPGYKLDVNGTAHITTAQDSVAPLTLKSTYNGSTAGPLLDLYRKSGTPSDGDNLGTITFTADTNVGSINEFARIESTALDVTDTTEDGALKLAVVTAGTLRSRVYMDPTETVFNDASQDFDFRVESNISSHALFVRGSDSAVGVGTAAPNAGSWSNAVTIQGASSVGLELMKGSSLYAFMGVQGSGSSHALDIAAYQNQSIRLRVGSNAGTTAVTILNDGKVGIGTVTPSSELHIASSDNRPTIRLQGNKTSDGNFADIYATNDGSNGEAQISFRRVGANDAVDMLFYTSATGSAMAERMRIASTGAITFNTAFTFPTADGSAGQVLQTNGSGTVTWATVSGGGGVSGSGTDHYIPRWNGTTALQDSSIIALDSGSVGIGTVAPHSALDVKEATGSSGQTTGVDTLTIHQGISAWTVGCGPRISFVGDADRNMGGIRSYCFGHEQTGLAFESGTASSTGYAAMPIRMVINHDGNVGIGTDAPGVRFHLVGAAGTVNSLATSVTAATMRIQHNSASSLSIFSGNTVSSETYFQAANYNGTTAYVIALNPYGGSVGIGTNAPADHLQVKGSGSQSLRLTSTSSHASIRVDRYNTSSDANFIIQTGGVNKWRLATGLGGNDEKLTIYDDIADVNMMSFKTAVGVGVGPSFGTREPDSALHVLGDTLKLERTDNAPALKLYNNHASPADGTALGYLQFTGKDNDGTANMVYSEVRGGVGYNTDTAVSGYLAFLTTNNGTSVAERMRIKYDGNVGIGTDDPRNKLTITDGATPYTTANLLLQIKRNASNGNDDTSKASIMLANNSNGFQVAYGGTTDRLRFINGGDVEMVTFLNGGNVGIGQIAPKADLHIGGSFSDAANDLGTAALAIKQTGTSAENGIYIERTGERKGYYIGITGVDGLTFRRNFSGTKSDIMSLTRDGNVGIGTNTPSEKLDVEGSLVVNVANSGLGEEGIFFRRGFSDSNKYNISILAYAHDGAGNFSDGISINGYDGVSFCTGASTRQERMRIVGGTGATSGFVGIGTNAPADTLHVYGAGTTAIFESSSANSYVSIKEASGGNHVYLGNQNGLFVIQTPGSSYSTKFQVTSAGNVGIGIAPTRKFHVYGSAASAYLAEFTNTHATQGYGVLIKAGDDNNVTALSVSDKDGNEKLRVRAGGQITFANAFTFPTADGSANQMLKTDGSGNLSWTSAGSGTITGSGSANYIPKFTGSSAIGNSTIATNGEDVAIGSTEYGVGGTIDLSIGNPGNTAGGITLWNTTTGTHSIGFGDANSGTARYEGYLEYAHADNSMRLGTLHAERIRIKSDGNVGIGTNTPVKKLDVRAAASWDGIHIGSTAGSATAIDFARSTTHANPTARIGVAEPAATHTSDMRFFTSDASGGAPNLVEKMRIDPNGNVGIGESSPEGLLSFKADESNTPKIRFQNQHSDNADAAISTYDDTSGTTVLIGSNLYINSSGSTTRFNTGEESAGFRADRGGLLQFYTGETGATATERMRLTAAGKVIINDTATTNNNNAQLYVNGPVYSSEFDLPSGGVLDWGNGDARIQEGLTTNYSLSLRNYDGSSAMVTTMFLKSGGDVGIGTVAPAAHLHVSKAAGTTTVLTQVAANSTVGFEIKKTGSTTQHWKIVDGQTANGTLEFYDATNSATRMAITGSGSVGLNKTPNSQYNLDIEGQMLLGGHMNFKATNSLQGIGFNRNVHTGAIYSSSYYAYQLHSNANNFELQRYNGSGTFLGYGLVCTAVGNIGIGTNSPDTQLDLSQSVDGPLAINIHNQSTNAAADSAISFETHGQYDFTIGIDRSLGTFSMCRNATLGTNEIVRIDLAGTISAPTVTIDADVQRVGIGTVSPAVPLHITKSAVGDNEIPEVIRLSTLNSASPSWSTTDGLCIGAEMKKANGTTITKQPIRFRYDGGDMATTFEEGNVGIGTNVPLDKLDVYGTGAIFRNLSDNADSVQIVRGTNHTANPDAKFYIYDNSSADWAAKINLDGASYGLDITGGADYFFLCRKASGDHLFSVHGSHTTVNDAGIDYDFRVESNNDDYLLYTDGGNDRVAISTTAPAAKLHVEGDFKVGTTNNGNWMGYKDVTLNGTTYTTALTINLNNHTGCYVKLFLSGDWSSHSAVAFVGEYFVQNGGDGYAEPGTVISEFDNTNTDSIESKIVDPSSDTFTIQLKLSTAANGTLAGKLSYHVMGMATAVS